MHRLKIGHKEFTIRNEVFNLINQLSKDRDGLKDLAIWMTGCGYDFCQHDYFNKKRSEFLTNPPIDYKIDSPFKHVTNGEECPCGPDTETHKDEGIIVHKREQ